jgi:hypothetical protein
MLIWLACDRLNERALRNLSARLDQLEFVYAAFATSLKSWMPSSATLDTTRDTPRSAFCLLPSAFCLQPLR